MPRVRSLLIALTAAILFSSGGCQMFHELQPHRLRRWNYGPDLSINEAMFSVADPIPETTAEGQPPTSPRLQREAITSN